MSDREPKPLNGQSKGEMLAEDRETFGPNQLTSGGDNTTGSTTRDDGVDHDHGKEHDRDHQPGKFCIFPGEFAHGIPDQGDQKDDKQNGGIPASSGRKEQCERKDKTCPRINMIHGTVTVAIIPGNQHFESG